MALEEERIERYGVLEGGEYRDARASARRKSIARATAECAAVRGQAVRRGIGDELGRVCIPVVAYGWVVVATGGFEPPT